MHLARDAMEDVVYQRCKKMGKEYGYTLWSICCLARIKSAMGEDEDAERDMRGAIDIATRNYDENHFAVLSGRGHLANVLVRQERYAEAEAIFKDVMKRAKYAAGAREDGDHPDRMGAMLYLAQCYQQQGKFQEGIQLCEEISQGIEAMGKIAMEHPFLKKAKEKQQELRQLAFGRTTPPSPQPAATEDNKGSERAGVNVGPGLTMIRHQTI